jgi:hypothetical protein
VTEAVNTFQVIRLIRVIRFFRVIRVMIRQSVGLLDYELLSDGHAVSDCKIIRLLECE